MYEAKIQMPSRVQCLQAIAHWQIPPRFAQGSSSAHRRLFQRHVQRLAEHLPEGDNRCDGTAYAWTVGLCKAWCGNGKRRMGGGLAGAAAVATCESATTIAQSSRALPGGSTTTTGHASPRQRGPAAEATRGPQGRRSRAEKFGHAPSSYPAPSPRAARRGGSTAPRSLQQGAAAARSGDEQRKILLERYRERVAKDPFDIGARVTVARAMLATGDADRARAFLDEAASLAPDRADVNGWRARALALTGDTAGAVQALEQVLRFDASAADEARLADHLRARASGAIAGAADFQDAYRAPLEDIVARAGEPGSGAPREVLHRMLVIDAGADGTARRWGRTVERVLTSAGARELDRLPFRAYPGNEEVRVLSASVHRADGTTLDARTGRTGGRGVFVVDLPPLEVGDVVDVEWRRDDLAPTIFGDYLGVDVPLRSDSRLPVVESTVVLLEPEGVALTTHMTAAPDGVEMAREDLDGGRRETRWTLRDVEPRRNEHLEPPSAELEPRVQASTYASWESFGEWWWNLISEEIDTSEEMRIKVAELTESASTPLERLRAIYDFVVTDVRYNAWEFGVHGYQPYSAPVIFSRRFGDCKDKAILMKTMLAEVGIEAWPVIIQAEGRRHEEDLSLAMVGHFNHCIAYVPAQEGIPEMFLDGTARYHPLEVLPDSDRGAKVVVVRDDGVDVRRVPFPEAAENRLVDETIVDMTGEGPARVEVVQRPSGRWDPLLRRTYGGDETARATAVERPL